MKEINYILQKEKEQRDRRKKYLKRRDNGLCVKCGKPVDREGALCTSCLKLKNEELEKDREKRLSLGLCPICGKNEIFEWEKSCPECKARWSTNYAKHADTKNERRREKTKMLKEQGICIRCGKNKVDEGHSTCLECRQKRNERSRRKEKRNIREEWKAEGLCAKCGSDDVVPGKLLCHKCYEISVKAIEKCNQTRPEGFNKTWETTNMRMRAKFRVLKDPKTSRS